MVEIQKWSQWNKWLEDHRADNALLPIYVTPVEEIFQDSKVGR